MIERVSRRWVVRTGTGVAIGAVVGMHIPLPDIFTRRDVYSVPSLQGHRLQAAPWNEGEILADGLPVEVPYGAAVPFARKGVPASEASSTRETDVRIDDIVVHPRSSIEGERSPAFVIDIANAHQNIWFPKDTAGEPIERPVVRVVAADGTKGQWYLLEDDARRRVIQFQPVRPKAMQDPISRRLRKSSARMG